eukprot:SAG22_NODE_76_length_22248_cov_14.352070_19_plen_103_part_01
MERSWRTVRAAASIDAAVTPKRSSGASSGEAVPARDRGRAALSSRSASASAWTSASRLPPPPPPPPLLLPKSLTCSAVLGRRCANGTGPLADGPADRLAAAAA